MKKKILIAFFSQIGETYVNGKTIPLAVGNTETVARKIAASTGGDLFHIEKEGGYPPTSGERWKWQKKNGIRMRGPCSKAGWREWNSMTRWSWAIRTGATPCLSRYALSLKHTISAEKPSYLTARTKAAGWAAAWTT